MLAETVSIYSALHTQIFLDFLYVVIGPSITTKAKFRFRPRGNFRDYDFLKPYSM